MPLRQIMYICWCFTSLEQLSEDIYRSDRWYLLVFCKSGAIILCHWSVRSLIYACILKGLSNYPMALAGQIGYICIYFASLEQLCDVVDRSDLPPVPVRASCPVKLQTLPEAPCMKRILTEASRKPCLSEPIMMPRKHPLRCLYFTSLEELFDAIDRPYRWYLLVFYQYWAMIRCHWSVRSLIFACILEDLSK